jgi:hypothetical protein
MANNGDFYGGVAIGNDYAGVDAAPTNGLIVEGNVAMGTSSPSTLAGNGALTPIFQVANTTSAGIGSYRYSTGGAGALIMMAQSGGTSIGNMTAVSSGAGIGQLIFEGSDGTYFQNSSAIYAAADAAVSSGIVPGRLVFSTTNASGTLTEDMRITSTGKVGIGTTSPAQALEVNGEVKVDTFASASATTVCQNGNVLSTCSSSIRYKEKIEPAPFGLKEVMDMRPITFKWKDRDEEDFGLVAEDVEKINPLFVTYARGQIEGVKYPQLTAVLVKAVQEQQAEIAKQQAQIDELKQMVELLTHQK